MKHILCLFGFHKFKSMDDRGMAGKHVCKRCGYTIPAIVWPRD